MRKAAVLTSLLAASCCVLTACGGGSKKPAAVAPTTSSSAAPTTTEAPTTTPTTTATTSASAPTTSTRAAKAPAGAFAYTPQGSKLKLGQTAVVPFKYGKNAGVIGIKVTSIVQGTAADLKSLKLGSRGAGLIPFFVHATITNVGGTNLAYSSVDSLHGSLADGSEAQDVIIFGSYAKCDNGDAGSGFTKKGASFQTCELAVAPRGVKVSGAQYNDEEAKGLHPKSDFFTAPIQWK